MAEEALMPSGSAALYRRTMLEEIGGFDDEFFLYCEDTDLGLRARWAGWKCLYVPQATVEHHYSHSAGRASGLKAYYVERNRLFVLVKNFPAGMLAAAPLATLARYWWHAWFLLQGTGSAARFRAEGNAGRRWPGISCGRTRRCSGTWVGCGGSGAQIRRQSADHAGGIPAPDAGPRDQRAEGGGALMRPQAPDRLLVIVPALNEEAAVGGVVREVKEHVPGTPVLVIDDCSPDDTIRAARAAGAEVLPMPHHLGLGGCVQAGYKLAYELGFEYVIRVDGDGQHDARDIPRILERLKSTGAEMVIGSRFVAENGSRTGAVRSLGIRFFRLVLRPILGRAGARSDLRIRGCEPAGAGCLQPQLSAGVSGDRGAGGAAAPALPLRGGAVQDSGRGPRGALDHGGEIAVLHRSRAAGRVRERA